MVEFFVRENPLLNPASNNDEENPDAGSSGRKDEPVMLDYGGFGFPDEQVMRDWTIMGCVTTIICSLAVVLGLSVLGYTFYSMYTEQHTVVTETGGVVASTGSRGLKRAEVRAFSIDCKWNYPSAICVTPDGRYLVTAGGPRTRSEDAESPNSARNVNPMNPGIAELETDEEDVLPSEQPLLTYDSRSPELPANMYVDFLNLGKNGKRVMDVPLKKEEVSKDDFIMDHTDLISVSSGTGPSIENLTEDQTSLDAHDENNVWKKTRPSVESYPMAFWSMETMQPVVVHWNHEFPIVSMSVSPDGTKVVSADSGGNAILWSLDDLPGENGMAVPTWHFVNKMTPQMRTKQGMGKITTIHAVTFTPSGHQFVMAATVNALDETGNSYTNCGALILWDLQEWKEVLRKRGGSGISNKIDTYYQTLNPVGKYCDLKYTPNGKYLLAAAAGTNAGMYYFDNRTNNPAYGICMCNLNPDEQRPRTAPVAEFKPNLVQGVSHHDFPNAESVVFAISPENTSGKGDKNALTVVSADNYGRIVFWQFAPSTTHPREGVKCSKYFSAKNSENTTRNVRSILYAPDMKYVMILGDDILMYSGSSPYDYMGSFRSTTGNSSNSMERTEFFLVSGMFTPDNKYFLGGGDDCMVRMWRMDEIPMDSRFLADRNASEKNANDEKEQSFEEIQKKYKSVGGRKNIPSENEEEDSDENWDKNEDRDSGITIENTQRATEVIEESGKLFKNEE